MEGEEQFEVTKHFDAKRANGYEAKIRRIVPGYEAMHDLALHLLLDALPAQAKILVSGAGTGHEVLLYSRANPAWHLTGVDPTEAMLSLAAERVQEQGLAERIYLQQGCVKDLPPGPNFQAATSILVMQFIPDDGAKKEYLAEIASRLQPHAKFIIIDLVGDKTAPAFGGFFSAWEARQLRMEEDREDVGRDFAHIRRDIEFIPEERMHALLQDAGFREIRKFFQSYLFSGWIAEKGA